MSNAEQEPVKMVAYNCTCGRTMKFESVHGVVAPQRPWVGLTEEDIDDAEIHMTSCRTNHESWIEGLQEFAQAIEAKLKEKNT